MGAGPVNMQGMRSPTGGSRPPWGGNQQMSTAVMPQGISPGGSAMPLPQAAPMPGIAPGGPALPLPQQAPMPNAMQMQPRPWMQPTEIQPGTVMPGDGFRNMLDPKDTMPTGLSPKDMGLLPKDMLPVQGPMPNTMGPDMQGTRQRPTLGAQLMGRRGRFG